MNNPMDEDREDAFQERENARKEYYAGKHWPLIESPEALIAFADRVARGDYFDWEVEGIARTAAEAWEVQHGATIATELALRTIQGQYADCRKLVQQQQAAALDMRHWGDILCSCLRSAWLFKGYGEGPLSKNNGSIRLAIQEWEKLTNA